MNKPYEKNNAWFEKAHAHPSTEMKRPLENTAPGPPLETIDNQISLILISTSMNELDFRRAEVLGELYQARALNEIAESLHELVRDGIGVKRPDET